jgi:hypothetical protein
MTVSISITVFWDVMPCSLVDMFTRLKASHHIITSIIPFSQLRVHTRVLLTYFPDFVKREAYETILMSASLSVYRPLISVSKLVRPPCCLYVPPP